MHLDRPHASTEEVSVKTEVGELLRKAWRMTGSDPCQHFKLSRERTARGDYTGAFLCCACGAYVDRGLLTN